MFKLSHVIRVEKLIILSHMICMMLKMSVFFFSLSAVWRFERPFNLLGSYL